MSLKVENLTVYYCMRRGDCQAVEDVTFNIEAGDSVGLVGESGCGKSTVAFAILGMLPEPGEIMGGHIYFDGEDIATMTDEEIRNIRWTKIAMVFQGAMNALNPILRVSDQITEAMLKHNRELRKEEALAKTKDLFKLVGMDPDRVNHYPFEFSGGMKQRAMIVMALACDPKFLIADEPTTALDVTVQAQIMQLLRRLADELGITLMLITHDLSVVAETCRNVFIMYAGKIVETGSVLEIFQHPWHPYAQGLIASIPSIERSSDQTLASIPGSPPNLLNPPPGCRFHPRCKYAQDLCKVEDPPLIGVSPGHKAACHLASGKITDESWKPGKKEGED
ncbi:MAG: ABC transporter ATP-binding protein [Candidatus Thorarchaeota archaeon]